MDETKPKLCNLKSIKAFRKQIAKDKRRNKQKKYFPNKYINYLYDKPNTFFSETTFSEMFSEKTLIDITNTSLFEHFYLLKKTSHKSIYSKNAKKFFLFFKERLKNTISLAGNSFFHFLCGCKRDIKTTTTLIENDIASFESLSIRNKKQELFYQEMLNEYDLEHQQKTKRKEIGQLFKTIIKHQKDFYEKCIPFQDKEKIHYIIYINSYIEVEKINPGIIIRQLKQLPPNVLVPFLVYMFYLENIGFNPLNYLIDKGKWTETKELILHFQSNITGKMISNKWLVSHMFYALSKINNSHEMSFIYEYFDKCFELLKSITPNKEIKKLYKSEIEHKNVFHYLFSNKSFSNVNFISLLYNFICELFCDNNNNYVNELLISSDCSLKKIGKVPSIYLLFNYSNNMSDFKLFWENLALKVPQYKLKNQFKTEYLSLFIKSKEFDKFEIYLNFLKEHNILSTKGIYYILLSSKMPSFDYFKLIYQIAVDDKYKSDLTNKNKSFHILHNFIAKHLEFYKEMFPENWYNILLTSPIQYNGIFYARIFESSLWNKNDFYSFYVSIFDLKNTEDKKYILRFIINIYKSYFIWNKQMNRVSDKNKQIIYEVINENLSLLRVFINSFPFSLEKGVLVFEKYFNSFELLIRIIISMGHLNNNQEVLISIMNNQDKSFSNSHHKKDKKIEKTKNFEKIQKQMYEKSQKNKIRNFLKFFVYLKLYYYSKEEIEKIFDFIEATICEKYKKQFHNLTKELIELIDWNSSQFKNNHNKKNEDVNEFLTKSIKIHFFNYFARYPFKYLPISFFLSKNSKTTAKTFTLETVISNPLYKECIQDKTKINDSSFLLKLLLNCYIPKNIPPSQMRMFSNLIMYIHLIINLQTYHSFYDVKPFLKKIDLRGLFYDEYFKKHIQKIISKEEKPSLLVKLMLEKSEFSFIQKAPLDAIPASFILHFLENELEEFYSYNNIFNCLLYPNKKDDLIELFKKLIAAESLKKEDSSSNSIRNYREYETNLIKYIRTPKEYISPYNGPNCVESIKMFVQYMNVLLDSFGQDVINEWIQRNFLKTFIKQIETLLNNYYSFMVYSKFSNEQLTIKIIHSIMNILIQIPCVVSFDSFEITEYYIKLFALKDEKLIIEIFSHYVTKDYNEIIKKDEKHVENSNQKEIPSSQSIIYFLMNIFIYLAKTNKYSNDFFSKCSNIFLNNIHLITSEQLIQTLPDSLKLFALWDDNKAIVPILYNKCDTIEKIFNFLFKNLTKENIYSFFVSSKMKLKKNFIKILYNIKHYHEKRDTEKILLVEFLLYNWSFNIIDFALSNLYNVDCINCDKKGNSFCIEIQITGDDVFNEFFYKNIQNEENKKRTSFPYVIIFNNLIIQNCIFLHFKDHCIVIHYHEKKKQITIYYSPYPLTLKSYFYKFQDELLFNTNENSQKEQKPTIRDNIQNSQSQIFNPFLFLFDSKLNKRINIYMNFFDFDISNIDSTKKDSIVYMDPFSRKLLSNLINCTTSYKHTFFNNSLLLFQTIGKEKVEKIFELYPILNEAYSHILVLLSENLSIENHKKLIKKICKLTIDYIPSTLYYCWNSFNYKLLSIIIPKIAEIKPSRIIKIKTMMEYINDPRMNLLLGRQLFLLLFESALLDNSDDNIGEQIQFCLRQQNLKFVEHFATVHNNIVYIWLCYSIYKDNVNLFKKIWNLFDQEFKKILSNDTNFTMKQIIPYYCSLFKFIKRSKNDFTKFLVNKFNYTFLELIIIKQSMNILQFYLEEINIVTKENVSIRTIKTILQSKNNSIYEKFESLLSILNDNNENQIEFLSELIVIVSKKENKTMYNYIISHFNIEKYKLFYAALLGHCSKEFILSLYYKLSNKDKCFLLYEINKPNNNDLPMIYTIKSMNDETRFNINDNSHKRYNFYTESINYSGNNIPIRRYIERNDLKDFDSKKPKNEKIDLNNKPSFILYMLIELDLYEIIKDIFRPIIPSESLPKYAITLNNAVMFSMCLHKYKCTLVLLEVNNIEFELDISESLLKADQFAYWINENQSFWKKTISAKINDKLNKILLIHDIFEIYSRLFYIHPIKHKVLKLITNQILFSHKTNTLISILIPLLGIGEKTFIYSFIYLLICVFKIQITQKDIFTLVKESDICCEEYLMYIIYLYEKETNNIFFNMERFTMISEITSKMVLPKILQLQPENEKQEKQEYKENELFDNEKFLYELLRKKLFSFACIWLSEKQLFSSMLSSIEKDNSENIVKNEYHSFITTYHFGYVYFLIYLLPKCANGEVEIFEDKIFNNKYFNYIEETLNKQNDNNESQSENSSSKEKPMSLNSNFVQERFLFILSPILYPFLLCNNNLYLLEKITKYNSPIQTYKNDFTNLSSHLIYYMYTIRQKEILSSFEYLDKQLYENINQFIINRYNDIFIDCKIQTSNHNTDTIDHPIFIKKNKSAQIEFCDKIFQMIQQNKSKENNPLIRYEQNLLYINNIIRKLNENYIYYWNQFGFSYRSKKNIINIKFEFFDDEQLKPNELNEFTYNNIKQIFSFLKQRFSDKKDYYLWNGTYYGLFNNMLTESKFPSSIIKFYFRFDRNNIFNPIEITSSSNIFEFEKNIISKIFAICRCYSYKEINEILNINEIKELPMDRILNILHFHFLIAKFSESCKSNSITNTPTGIQNAIIESAYSKSKDFNFIVFFIECFCDFSVIKSSLSYIQSLSKDISDLINKKPFSNLLSSNENSFSLSDYINGINPCDEESILEFQFILKCKYGLMIEFQKQLQQIACSPILVELDFSNVIDICQDFIEHGIKFKNETYKDDIMKIKYEVIQSVMNWMFNLQKSSILKEIIREKIEYEKQIYNDEKYNLNEGTWVEDNEKFLRFKSKKYDNLRCEERKVDKINKELLNKIFMFNVSEREVEKGDYFVKDGTIMQGVCVAYSIKFSYTTIVYSGEVEKLIQEFSEVINE